MAAAETPSPSLPNTDRGDARVAAPFENLTGDDPLEIVRRTEIFVENQQSWDLRVSLSGRAFVNGIASRFRLRLQSFA
jgi:hypothetical protein